MSSVLSYHCGGLTRADPPLYGELSPDDHRNGDEIKIALSMKPVTHELLKSLEYTSTQGFGSLSISHACESTAGSENQLQLAPI